MGNCLIYALKKFIKEDGYIVVRKSKYGPWLHFMYSKDLDKVTHFVPLKKRLSCEPFAKILFKGKVKEYKKKG